MIHPERFERRFGGLTARELICDHVLRLTYTAHDMQPFAPDRLCVSGKGEGSPPQSLRDSSPGGGAPGALLGRGIAWRDSRLRSL